MKERLRNTVTYIGVTVIIVVVPCLSLLIWGIWGGLNSSGERPIDFPESIWVSENPYIQFEIDNSEENYGGYHGGVISISGRVIEIKVFFEMLGNGMYIYDTSDNLLIYGIAWNATSDKCYYIVSGFDDEKGSLFDDFTVIKFVKETNEQIPETLPSGYITLPPTVMQ